MLFSFLTFIYFRVRTPKVSIEKKLKVSCSILKGCVFMSEIPKYNRDKYYRIMDITQSNYANQWKRLSKDSKRADFILIYYSLSIIIFSLSVKFYPTFFDETWSSYSGLILSVIVLIYSIINSKAGYPERITKIQVALNEVKRLKREVGALPENILGKREMPNNTKNFLSQMTKIVAKKSVCSNSCEMECNCDIYPQCQATKVCLKLESLKREYDEIVSNTEIRDDLDFYFTILHLCKQYKLNPFNGKAAKNIDPKEINDDDPVIKEIRGYISENNPAMQRFHLTFLTICHFVLYVAPVIIFLAGIIINSFVLQHK